MNILKARSMILQIEALIAQIHPVVKLSQTYQF